MIEEVIAALREWGLLGLLVLLVLYLVANPDKAYRWGEILAVILSRIHRGFDRRAVKLGLQRELQRFAIDLAKETGRAKPQPVDVQWTSSDEAPDQFHHAGRLVLRLHPHDHQDRNLVTASLLVVSQVLARRAKGFIAPKQARSTDLYAVDRLLRRAPNARDLFREEVMGPEVDHDRDMRDLVESFQEMDRSQLFFPVYVRELNHLGQEVVVAPRDERLIVDVERLIDFLVRFAGRTVGEVTDRTLRGNVLRCALFIVARRERRESGVIGQPVDVLRGFAAQGIKTIYVIGRAIPENRSFLERVVSAFAGQTGWRLVDRREYTAILNMPDGSEVPSPSHMIVLRYPAPVAPPAGDDASLDE